MHGSFFQHANFGIFAFSPSHSSPPFLEGHCFLQPQPNLGGYQMVILYTPHCWTTVTSTSMDQILFFCSHIYYVLLQICTVSTLLLCRHMIADLLVVKLETTRRKLLEVSLDFKGKVGVSCVQWGLVVCSGGKLCAVGSSF